MVIAESMDQTSKNSQESLINEGFEVAQLANATKTSSTLSRIGARFAAGKGLMAKVVRSYQDLFDHREALEDLLLKYKALR